MHLSDHRKISERYFFPRQGVPEQPTYVQGAAGKLACAHRDRGHAMTLLHFHGNGEIVADYLPEFPDMLSDLGVNTFLAEYRGYGDSEGEPQLGAMFDDLPAIQEAAGPPEKLIVFGRSIGSIYAIEFVSRYPEVAGLVLESGIADVLERILLRVSPEELGAEASAVEDAFGELFNHKSKLASFDGPCLILHAEHDHLVNQEHAKQNATWAGSETELVILPKGDHNSIFFENRERYLAELGRFVSKL
jgi:pimeloyl-ACP methyl ester carboxylesterase